MTENTLEIVFGPHAPKDLVIILNHIVKIFQKIIDAFQQRHFLRTETSYFFN